MHMTNNNSLLNRLERKFGNFGIPNLMTLIVFFTAIAYFGDYFIDPDAGVSLSSLLYFDREAIFRGEVWRIITFAFIPPASSPIFIAFSLYQCLLFHGNAWQHHRRADHWLCHK